MHVSTFLRDLNACKGRERGAKVRQKSEEVTFGSARVFASGGVGPDFVIAAESTPFQIIPCHNILTLYNTR